MTRSNAREIAVHLLYAMDYSGQSPDEIMAASFDRDYYAHLAAETDVYAERPNRQTNPPKDRRRRLRSRQGSRTRNDVPCL